jgi:hypothetical protein
MIGIDRAAADWSSNRISIARREEVLTKRDFRVMCRASLAAATILGPSVGAIGFRSFQHLMH